MNSKTMNIVLMVIIALILVVTIVIAVMTFSNHTPQPLPMHNEENVEANDADVDAELEKMAAMYNMEVEKIKSSLRETDIEDIKGQIKIRKTLDLLVENATIA